MAPKPVRTAEDTGSLIHDITLQSSASWLITTAVIFVIFLVFALFCAVYKISSAFAMLSCCITCIVFLLLNLSFKINKESILLMKSLGLQVSTTNYFGKQKNRYIGLSHIQDVVINEAITMHSVKYYLAVLLRDPLQVNKTTEIVPLFMHSMPRLAELKTFQKQMRAVLWDESKEMGAQEKG